MTRLFQFICTATAILFTVALINYFVDPFGYFGKNRIGYFMNSEREIKAGVLNSKSFDGIFLGSSKVTYFNPDDYHEFRIFNAGFGSAMPEEILYLLRDTDPRINFILLEINLFMFNEHTFPYVNEDNFPRHNVKGWLDYLMSLRILNYSRSAMNKYTTGARPSYRENGSRYPEDITGKDRSRLKRAMHVLVANHYNFNRNGLSAKRVRVLYDIKAWAQRRNVTLIVWINPFPQEVLDLFANSDVGRLFAEFKQMVKSIFPDVIDLSAVLPDDKYYQDDFYHYTSDTAELIYRNYLLPRLKLIEPTTSVVAPL